MNSKVKEIAKGIKNCIVDFRPLYVMRNYGYLHEYGWWNSYKENASIDSNGNPIPWLTYPCIELISNRIEETFDVFEYGCGNSTHWWASRVRSVISCEHDELWCSRIGETIPTNVTLIHRELEHGGEYSKEILKHQDRFDVIIVDGRDRVKCARNSAEALKKRGVIIWDNTERDRYFEGLKYLESLGFKRLDLWGVGPIRTSKWCTTICYRKDNCLDI